MKLIDVLGNAVQNSLPSKPWPLFYRKDGGEGGGREGLGVRLNKLDC